MASMTTAECIERFKGAHLTVVQATVEKRIGDRLGDAWLNDHYERIFEAFRAEIKPIPRAREVWKICQFGNSFCVASKGRFRKMQITLGATGIGADRSSTATSIPPQWSNGRSRARPVPVCPRQRRMLTDDCIVVEDNATGVKAAVAAQIRVIGFAADDINTPALANAGAQVDYL